MFGSSSRSRAQRVATTERRGGTAPRDGQQRQVQQQAQRSPQTYSREDAERYQKGRATRARKHALQVGTVLLIILAVIALCAVGWVGWQIHTASQEGSSIETAPAPTIPDVISTIVERIAPEPVDPRREDLELDPEKTEWNYEEGEEKVVYLTFDDGPSPVTSTILDILDTYGVKATFFVTAQFPEYIDLIADEYGRGHTVGMHTYTHEYSIYQSLDTYFNDLNQISAIVEGQIGYVPFLVRLPGGSSNTVSRSYATGIMTSIANELLARGYQYWDWNAETGDGGTVTVDQAYYNAIAPVGYGMTDVVILAHDMPAKQTTVDALPSIIEYYLANGYEFRAIDRNAYVSHHGIAN